MSSGDVSRRRSTRAKRARDVNGARGGGSNKKRIRKRPGMGTWKPADQGYQLIREGAVLQKTPKELQKARALTEAMLWHFKATSGHTERLKAEDGHSLYEGVFRVAGMDPGVYAYPTHEQLMQIYKGTDMTKATAIREDGTPMVTDKRLRRHMRDARNRLQNHRRTKQRRQLIGARVTRRSKEEMERRANAPIPIDDKISFSVPSATLASIKKAGLWDRPFNWRNVPKRQRLNDLVKKFAVLAAMVGPAEPLTDEERREEESRLSAVLETRAEAESDDDASAENSVVTEKPASGSTIPGINDNSVSQDPIIYPELGKSGENFSPCYFPDAGQFVEGEDDENDEYDDEDMEMIYRDVDVNTVTLEKRSKRQRVNQAARERVESSRSHLAITGDGGAQAPPKKQRTSEQPTNEDEEEKEEDGEDDVERELNALFGEEDDDSEKSADDTTDRIDGIILNALKEKGSFPGMPEMWYMIYQTSGAEVALEAVKKTHEYAMLREIFQRY